MVLISDFTDILASLDTGQQTYIFLAVNASNSSGPMFAVSNFSTDIISLCDSIPLHLGKCWLAAMDLSQSSRDENQENHEGDASLW